MARAEDTDVNRRRFLKGVAVAGAGTAAAVLPQVAQAQPAPAAQKAASPTAAQRTAETSKPVPTEPGLAPSCGSDFMVDVMKAVGIDYVFSNTAQSFAPLQESVVNYANNQAPEFITCMHEESSVGMAHGYAKASGKAAAIFCHATVGTQHAAMAIYNAYCDRVPVIAFLGNQIDATTRGNATEWRHAAQDPAAFVRDFTKWDDQPITLQHFAESLVRGHQMAMTPPMSPVCISTDFVLQSEPLHEREKLKIPKITPISPPAGDLASVREVARLLVAANSPVIMAGHLARTPAGMKLLVELAELLNAPVIDQGDRQNFPNTHYLNQGADGQKLIRGADVVLGLELTDLWGAVNTFVEHEAGLPKTKAGAKIIGISANDLLAKANYQSFQRYPGVDMMIVGDGEATLPLLIESVKSALTADRKNVIAARADGFRKAHAAAYEASRQAVTLGWDASPISTGRMCMELYEQIKNDDWALVSVGSSESFMGNWPHRLWHFEHHHQYLGVSGGGGVGYGLPAAVGAALANKGTGRISVNLQCDGDFMYAPGALWTAAHHRIPLLTVMHNNRAYAQETMWVQHAATKRGRGVDRTKIGTEINDPPIDFAKLAQSFGVYAEGPIADPAKLGPALQRAVAVVRKGLPALVDVVTQMR